jgi:hypothetical protein
MIFHYYSIIKFKTGKLLFDYLIQSFLKDFKVIELHSFQK